MSWLPDCRHCQSLRQCQGADSPSQIYGCQDAWPFKEDDREGARQNNIGLPKRIAAIQLLGSPPYLHQPVPPNCHWSDSCCWAVIENNWMALGDNHVTDFRLQFSSMSGSLFFLLLGKNNTGTSFHITQVGLRSLGSDILENFSRNGGYVVLARSHSVI